MPRLGLNFIQPPPQPHIDIMTAPIHSTLKRPQSSGPQEHHEKLFRHYLNRRPYRSAPVQDYIQLQQLETSVGI